MEFIKIEPDAVKFEVEEEFNYEEDKVEMLSQESDFNEATELALKTEGSPEPFIFVTTNQPEDSLWLHGDVKEELVDNSRDVLDESNTVVHNEEMPAREKWDHCCDTRQLNGVSVESTSVSGVAACKVKINDELSSQLHAENSKLISEDTDDCIFEKSNKSLEIELKPVVVNPLRCEICGKCFSNWFPLRRHSIIHRSNKPFKCDVCGKEFDRSSNLKSHSRIHTGDKPFKCDVCSKFFAHASTLSVHLRTHTGDKPFRCNFCHKCFAYSDSLKLHEAIHTGYKPFKCNVCGKSFDRSTNLNLHLRLHSGDKPFKCDVCGKAFALMSYLKHHLRLHTSDKTFKCNVCGKCFKHSSHLKEHLRIHTGDKPYKCHVCGKGFTQSGALKVHLRIHKV